MLGVFVTLPINLSLLQKPMLISTLIYVVGDRLNLLTLKKRIWRDSVQKGLVTPSFIVELRGVVVWGSRNPRKDSVTEGCYSLANDLSTRSKYGNLTWPKTGTIQRRHEPEHSVKDSLFTQGRTWDHCPIGHIFLLSSGSLS